MKVELMFRGGERGTQDSLDTLPEGLPLCEPAVELDALRTVKKGWHLS